MSLSVLLKVTLKAPPASLSLSVNLSISIYLYLYRRISKSSLDCSVKSITVLRWHRAYIIFLWISISADTSHRRGSLDEMQMARYVNANLPSGRHEHNEDGVRSWHGFCDAITFRHSTGDWFVRLVALITKLILTKLKIRNVFKIIVP